MRLDPDDVAICVADPLPAGPEPASTSPPVVQTSLFSFPDFASLVAGLEAEHEHTVYSRGRNPTIRAVEDRLARLEGGDGALCFASGMGAISAVLHGVLRAGDHVLFVNQTYGPTLQLARYLARFGVEHDVCLDLAPRAVERAVRPETRLVWMESPGTMSFRVLDVPAVCEIAAAGGIVTVLDNSWATPLLQKPLELGVDVVVHTATKYLGGHSDLVAGAVVSNAERIERLFYDTYLLHGATCAPWTAWLLLRGMRTLPARLAQHERDGLRVAEFLGAHARVADVHHPALSADAALVERQLRGFSGTFSFTLDTDEYSRVAGFIDRLERFRIGVSWGGVESLVLSPARPDAPSGLVRLSVGLEGADLLIEDLDRALAAT
ncbi:MAG: trans-sulfuration enzyme family protein [Gemmatimonadota bacterium]